MASREASAEHAPIFCGWDVLGETLAHGGGRLDRADVGPKFHGGSWGGGASPAATCASWRLSSAASIVPPPAVGQSTGTPYGTQHATAHLAHRQC